MKHTNIAATLGWATTEDLNEGLFLQPEEAAAIDAALEHVGAGKNAVAELETVNNTIATHEATIQTLTEQATANQATITGLQADVARLGAGASGSGSVLKPAAGAEAIEEKINENGKPSFDSADHPANRFADSQKKYDSGLPAKK